MSALLEHAAQEVARTEREIRRRLWLKDPVLWAKERLGYDLWSGQREILYSVAENRRTAAMTCHEIGKSFSAATVVGWWIDAHPPGEAFVVTSAPTANQVRAILWREIGRMHAAGGLDGYVNQTEWQMTMPAGNTELVAMGRKPDEYNPTAFQGIHSRYVLYVFDEACGIPTALWDAADSIIANDFSKALAIGNPDVPGTEFFDICKPGSGWKVHSISAFDTPNFTGEKMDQKVLDQLIGKTYVEERRRKWANRWYWVDSHGNRCEVENGVRVVCPEGLNPQDTNPLWQSKVLGRFPEVAHLGGLIPLLWIKRAQEVNLEEKAERGPNELGQDVGAGGDESCVAHRRGPVVRIIHEDQNPDTMQTCGNLINLIKTTGATVAKVDVIGIGKGVVDRAVEQNKPVVGINVGEGADDSEAYINKRAELWWAVRERFETNEIDLDPEDEDLAAQLVELRFKRTSSGKIQIESKDEAKRRGVPSPNRADAVMLAFAPGEPEMGLTWGSRR